ncbi:hypothetical protein IQ264_11345 [Phormidium sp. LEGE 05292]|nr:hypothetical protein [Phormidium sp. LEGE 05292]MBE9226019.1 hypothetical protein [Phormidium sp. LEGE 05292]
MPLINLHQAPQKKKPRFCQNAFYNKLSKALMEKVNFGKPIYEVKF